MIKCAKSFLLVYAICIFVLGGTVFAQEESDLDIVDDIDDIELYLDEDENQRRAQRPKKRKTRKRAKGKLAQISDLANLAPFSDVAVIQPRYLRKSNRFSAFGGGALLMNEAFFKNMGGVLKLSYYFTEKWGIEGSAFFLSSSNRQVTDSLAERSIETASLVTPQKYYGLDLLWNPIYGKMAFFNDRIIPFDLYFSFGAGLTSIETSSNATSSSTTLKLGTGQIFAIRDWMAFRWDFSWHFFQPEVVEGETTNGAGTTNNLFLLVGMTFFLSETQR